MYRECRQVKDRLSNSPLCKVAKDKVLRSIVATVEKWGKLALEWKTRVDERENLSLSPRVEATWRASDCATLSRGFTIEYSDFFLIKIACSFLPSPAPSLSSTLSLLFALFSSSISRRASSVLFPSSNLNRSGGERRRIKGKDCPHTHPHSFSFCLQRRREMLQSSIAYETWLARVCVHPSSVDFRCTQRHSSFIFVSSVMRCSKDDHLWQMDGVLLSFLSLCSTTAITNKSILCARVTRGDLSLRFSARLLCNEKNRGETREVLYFFCYVLVI